MSSRRLSIGLGDSFRSLSIAGVALAALLFLGACTSNGAGDSTTTSSIPQSTSSSADPPATSTSTSISTAATTTLPPTQDVIDAWSAYWDAWAEVRASDDLDPAPLNVVAAVDVVEGALTLFERQRTSGLGAVQTEVSLHATVTDSDSDKTSIEDCVLLSPSFTDTVGVWYQADLARREGGWVVEAVRIPSGGGCAPRAIVEAAIAGYEAFYAGWVDFWDPANPDSTLIGEVLTEPQKTLIVDLLADHRTRGVALRGRPALHPEVVEVRSPTELVILSCLEPASDYGVYDIDSGERVDDVPAVRNGQRNLESAVMVLEDDLWKVSDLQGQVDFRMRIRTYRPRTSVRLIVAAAIFGSAMLLMAAPAWAHHCSGEGDIYQGGGDVVAECHGQTPGRPGGRTVHEMWNIYCAAAVGEYQDGDEVEFYATDQLTPGDVEHLGFDPTGEYWWWNVTCWRGGEPAYSYEFAVEVIPPVPPEAIRDVAAARLEPPPPDPETSPPLARQTFVQVPTWLWLDSASWAPLEVSETRGLTTVTVRATPTQARWVMGDGGGVTCLGPGVVWVSGLSEDDTDCSYTYLHSSYGEPEGRFGASVTVTWEFEWWINDVYQGTFGTVDVSTSFVVAVAEIQAVETGG